jgi:uncharacterized damage-inducible protein DinB
MTARIFATLAGGALWLSVAAAAAEAPTVARLYDAQVSSIERDIVPLAEAMPADKYNFAPTQGEFKGVRTFAQQAKHVAAVIYLVAAAAQKEKPPVDTGGENGPDAFAGKEQIVKFLKDSFAYAHKAAQSLTEKNQLELVKSPFGEGEISRGGAVSVVAWHSFDHYGQMVVYARMNGIVPPASAGAK